MDYCIRSNNVYIRLDNNGRPITCNEAQIGRFEYSKACNICNSLPKIIAKTGHFVVEAIPEVIKSNVEDSVHSNEKDVVNVDSYKPCENVTRWIDEFAKCEDVLNSAKERNEELNTELSDVDLRLSDILHIIELSDKMDMFSSWKLINEIRELRKERRRIKDEKLILSGIKSQGIDYLHRESVQKCVDGLSKRKYRIRIVDDE